MTNKRTATFMAETLAVFLLFVSSGEADLSGFLVSDLSGFDPLPEINYLQDPTSRELKKRIVSALKTLSIDGKQSCLVQYWAATNAGKTHLLATTDQPFGIYGNDEGLELYRKACLHHKLYVHRKGKISFGLPGHAFKDRTPHQTQHVHDYPEEHRPPCADKAIFSRKWGSFAVPVILADECVGVLEIVDTEPAHTYDGDINEVNKALK
ncbi:RWP-RK domain-containing protein, partial [Tanacetum coccineum]